MKYFYILLLVIIYCPSITYAQSNYKPGLVVTLKGDTIHGFIDYKDWENNPVSINFKSSLSTQSRQYTPNEITYFKVSKSEAYQKYNGPISIDETNINRITRGRDTGFRTATVFLKIEQDGKFITLYSYADDLKKRYFISEKTNNEPFELIYRVYFSTEQDNNQTINEQKYKGQLIYLSSKYKSNSDALQTTIENASYNHDLVDVVSKINGSAKQDNGYSNPAFSFYAGISSGITAVKAPTNTLYSYSNSYLPRISIGINAYTNPDVGTFIFRGEVGFFANTNKTFFKQDFYGDGTKSFYTLNQYTFSINPQILYNVYNTESFKFYLDAGASLNLSEYGAYTVNNGKHGTTTDNSFHYDASWISIPVSAGIILNNKIGIFASYTIPAKITNDNFKFYSTQIGIDYIFGHRK